MLPVEVSDPATIGPYRVIGVLGTGGMGRVYLTRSRAGRAVAVKVVRPELANDAAFRIRFRREIETARRVDSAFTAPVLDADADGPLPWLATEYIPAPSLQEVVEKHGPLPETAVRRLGAGLAEALSGIHRAGLIHRDLKPSNILIAADGVRVIDFGIARAADGAALTEAGVLIGSVGYMPPEQAEGHSVAPAGDVFSLGAVLAYAATGRPPFGTGPPHVVLYRLAHQHPDLSQVPPALQGLIAACMSVDMARRPAASHLSRVLLPVDAEPASLPDGIARDIVERQDVATAVPPRPARRRVLLAAAATIGTVAVAGSAAAILDDRTKSRSPAVVVPTRLWSTRVAKVQSTALSGQTVVCVGSSAVTALESSAGTVRWTVNGGVDQDLDSPVMVAGGVAYLVFDKADKNHHGLCAVDVATGQVRWTWSPIAHQLIDLLGVRGSLIACSAAHDKNDPLGDDTYVIDAGTRAIVWHKSFGTELVMPRTGNVLYLVDPSGRAQAVDLSTGSTRWSAQVGSSTFSTVSGDAKTAYFVGVQVRAVDTATGRTKWLFSPPVSVANFSSPVASDDSAVYAVNGKLYSVDSHTGVQRWHSAEIIDADASDLAVVGGTVVVSTSGGTTAGALPSGLYGWDTETGRLRWRLPLPGQRSAKSGVTLTVANGRMYTPVDAELLAYRLSGRRT